MSISPVPDLSVTSTRTSRRADGRILAEQTLTHMCRKHTVGAEFVRCAKYQRTLDTFTCGRMRGTCVRACVCERVHAHLDDARPAEASMLTTFS